MDSNKLYLDEVASTFQQRLTFGGGTHKSLACFRTQNGSETI